MKKFVFIISLLLIGCSKEELFVEPVIDNTPSPTPFTIYKTSFETHEYNNGYYSTHTTELPDNGLLVVGLTYVDFNNDGYIDILGKDENQPGVLKLYINDGVDYYSSILQTQGSSVSIINGPRKIVTSDFNNDGLLDIVLALAPDDETSVRGLYILENKGNYFIEHTIKNGERDWIHTVTTGDVNNDGNTDIFYGGSGHILMGNGDFTFSEKELPRIMTHEDPWVPGNYHSRGISQELVDINNDGWVDILMGYHLNDVDYTGQEYSNSHVIHYGTGDETLFTEAYVLQSNYEGTNITLDFSVLDLDNDGDLDLFVNSNFNYGGRGYVIQYYENNGYMNFTNKTSEVFQDDSNLNTGYYATDWIKCIDMNSDGVKELMVEGPNWSGRNEQGTWQTPTWNGYQLNNNGKFERKMFK